MATNAVSTASHGDDFALSFEQVITYGRWLQDCHIERFAEMLKAANCEFDMQPPWKVQCPQWIDQVSPDRKHIQILHSCENFRTNQGGHWVCCYYDTQKIYIYDSLNRNKLHRHHKTYIEKLFPFYPLDNIEFRKVQQQPNSSDCGVFSIAFATTILYGVCPENVRYTTSLMRQHLLKMFTNNTLEPFPSSVQTGYRDEFPSLMQSLHRPKDKLNVRDEVKLNREKQRTEHKQKVRERISKKKPSTNDTVANTDPITITTIRNPPPVCNVEPISISSTDSVSPAPSAKDIQNLKWAAIKDKVNERRRAKYAASKLNTASNIPSFESPTEQDKTSNAVQSTEPKVNLICTSSTYSAPATPDAKEIQNFKWASIKDEVNKRRRAKYAASKLDIANVESVSHESKGFQRSDWSLRKDRVNKARREKYIIVTFNKRKRKLNDDSLHDEDVYANKRKKCSSSSEEKRFLKRKAYAAKVESEREKKRARYAASKEINRSKKSLENKIYYKRHKQTSVLAKTKLKIARNISNKYRHVRQKCNTRKLLHSKEQYVMNVYKTIGESAIENRMEAEWIIKWCLHVREKYIFAIKTKLKSIREKSEVCLTQISECLNATLDDKVNVLCGPIKQHTASSEAYFAETAYEQPLYFPEAIVMNKEGQAMNILPISNGKKIGVSWICSSLCKPVDSKVLDAYNNFLVKICECSLGNVQKRFSRIHACTVRVHNDDKLGHSHSCYINPTICKSLFLSVEILSPHFPTVRMIKRLFYLVQSSLQKLDVLDEALETSNIEILRDIAVQAQKESKTFEVSSEIDLNEDSILETHFAANKLLTKCSMDTPRFVCISCEKLCFRKDISEIENLHSRITSPFWNDLMKHIQNDGLDAEYICNYCLKKFRSNKLPPTCILNNLITGEVPEVMRNLNDYEKLLIQRAKAFQIVQKMGTVGSKNLPHREMNKKVIGRTFHLPLPIEETLKKICPNTDPLNREHELYILVRGIPTKSKIVWENLVNVQKVYNVLMWLKEHNPLYSEINLPLSSGSLLEDLQNVEFELEKGQHAEVNNNDVSENEKKEQKAFLTQKSQSDDFYEQFTIHPMYSDKENKSATELYQMLKVQDVPLANYYKLLDLKCYPDLYPYGINGQREERTVRLTDFEYIKCKLMSKHERFRQNIQYLFYLLNDNNIRQLNSGIFHKMNVTNARWRYTAGSYLEQLAKGELEGNLNTIFARLRNTEQFWRKPRSDLNCMLQHYGPATWFLTLSPTEYLWTDLIEYLREVNPSMAHMSANSLIAADPVSVSRFMDNKFRAMLHFICSKSNPIGEVIHFFWRREYQTRGTQHFHLLIWIKDAPVLGTSSTEEVVNFISKYVTCRIPEKNVSPILHRRVTTHQHHNHNSYCMRTKKTKRSTTRACRFGFPRPVTNTFLMRDVACSVAGRRQLKSKSRLYDLPRSQNEICINDYNPPILCVWEGNMDLQFIGEISSLLSWYCTKYISKKEKSYITQIFEQINSTKSLKSYLWNVALRMLCNRECGAPEAADTLLGLSLYGTDPSTTIRWIDVNIIRSRKLKPHKEILAMDADSTDIFCNSLVDYYYPTRPTELNEINLYDFAKWYDVVFIKPKRKVEYYTLNDGKFLRKRKREYLINHYKNDVGTQPEKYFFALLLLFQPWRDVDELHNGFDTYAESFLFAESQLTEALQYHEKLTEIKENFNRAKELVEQKIAENLEQEKDTDNECDANGVPLGCNPIEADDAMKDFVDIVEKHEVANITQMISELNADQKRIFDKVTKTIQLEDEILRLYGSGEGGTGKSFLINTIRCWLKQTIGKDTAVTAPTGIAAFNINGLTVHRLFQLPVEHGQTPKYKELSDAVLKVLRDQLKNVSLIIIDEVSMISNITLLYIHLRLTEIFNTSNVDDGWFGKKHILLFGDLLQLPPVREEPAFIKVSTSKAEKLLDSLGSADIWANLFSYDELIINMRQKNDTSYREMLSRIRLGVITAADSKVLESRKINFSSINLSDRLRDLCDYINELPCDTVCLLPTCHLCDVLNENMLNRIPSEEIKLVAHDVVDCASYNRKKASKILDRDDEDSSRTAGLARIITIKIGAKVMLRRNIDVTLGLVNGTIGKVISISRVLDTNDVDKIKIVLTNGMAYEIERVSVKFQIMDGAYVIRKQFPLCLSYGITIHKSQGLSLNNAVIDAGNSIFSCGQVYVALSRVTSLEGLHLINYDPNSVKANELSIIEYNRLRQLYRPDIAQIKVCKQRGPKVPDFIWAIPKHVHECQETQGELKAGKNVWHVNGLQNTDGVSCYANATIQCIFNCQTIRDEIMKNTFDQENALALLLETYVGRNTDSNSLLVRQYVGEEFIENRQEDAPQFFMELCNKLEVLKNAVEHKLTTKTVCQGCHYTTTVEAQPNYVLLLTVPQTNKASTLQEIIDYTLSLWNVIEGECNRCGDANRMIKTSISSVKQVLIVQLKITSVNKDTLHLSKMHHDIKAIPTTIISTCSEKYKVQSALFHHGPNVYTGHYTSMLRSGKTAWIYADDMKIEKKSWPRNSKDCYMFFLEQIRK